MADTFGTPNEQDQDRRDQEARDAQARDERDANGNLIRTPEEARSQRESDVKGDRLNEKLAPLDKRVTALEQAMLELGRFFDGTHDPHGEKIHPEVGFIINDHLRR